MAKVNVYRSSASEQSSHLEVRRSRKENDGMISNSIEAESVQVDTHVELKSLPVNNSTRGARNKELFSTSLCAYSQLHQLMHSYPVTIVAMHLF